MKIIKTKKRKISAVLTAVSVDADTDRKMLTIDEWRGKVPRIYVLSKAEPIQCDGMRWLKSDRDIPAFRALLWQYAMGIPGTDVCMITSPDVMLSGDNDTILEFVENSRMDITWASYINLDGATVTPPTAFVLSSSIVPHMINDVPIDMTMDGADWKLWMHEWLTRGIQRNRYFDGSQYGLISKVKESKPEAKIGGIAAVIEAAKMLIPPSSGNKKINIAKVDKSDSRV